MMRYELFIALRHIRARKRQTILSVAAIGIAVMILMVSQAFMAGFTQELYSKTVYNLPHVIVSPQDGDDYIHLYKNIVDKINNIDGVIASSPYLVGEASFKFKDNTKNAALKGVMPSRENAVAHTKDDIIKGNYDELTYSDKSIIVGDKFAEDMELDIGDNVEVSFPNANPVSLKVVAIYDTGTALDESLTYISLHKAQDFYDTTDVINGISLRLADFNRDREIAQMIEDYGYNAAGWTDNNPEILRTIAIETVSNNVTLGFILLIASFGVVSTLNMVVMSKVKEIGILLAMGASKSSIRFIFLIESGLLGLAGAVLGTAAGVTLALSIGTYPLPEGVYGLDSIPVVVRAGDVLTIITIVFLLNLFAGLYPAQKAASLDPVEAISTH
ncbi:ABC transporter permease [Methanolobus vulcani]